MKPQERNVSGLGAASQVPRRQIPERAGGNFIVKRAVTTRYIRPGSLHTLHLDLAQKVDRPLPAAAFRHYTQTGTMNLPLRFRQRPDTKLLQTKLLLAYASDLQPS